MDGIKVVAHLVRCAADLLVCTDLDTNHLRFADAEVCRSKLPALIIEFESVSTAGDVVTGRCRFQLDRTPAEFTGANKPSASRETASPMSAALPSQPRPSPT